MQKQTTYKVGGTVLLGLSLIEWCCLQHLLWEWKVQHFNVDQRHFCEEDAISNSNYANAFPNLIGI